MFTQRAEHSSAKKEGKKFNKPKLVIWDYKRCFVYICVLLEGCNIQTRLDNILDIVDLILFFFSSFQTEIAKRLNAIIAQILPFLSQEHQQQVATAVERAKQVTMTELNAIIGVSVFIFFNACNFYVLHK